MRKKKIPGSSDAAKIRAAEKLKYRCMTEHRKQSCEMLGWYCDSAKEQPAAPLLNWCKSLEEDLYGMFKGIGEALRENSK